MSLFQPIDQSGPDSRRKQLINKLMQQAQVHSAASAATLGAGIPLHAGALAHPAGTQSNNMSTTAMARLGALGYAPHGSEQNTFTPGPVLDLHASAHDISGVAAIPWTSTPSPPPTPAPSPTPVGPPPSPPGLLDTMGQMYDSSMGASGLVPLGGSHFYDPTTDTVQIHNNLVAQ